jgi:hypothetical protein
MDEWQCVVTIKMLEDDGGTRWQEENKKEGRMEKRERIFDGVVEVLWPPSWPMMGHMWWSYTDIGQTGYIGVPRDRKGWRCVDVVVL